MAPSRISRKKKKGDKVLNWSIGVVSVLILIIGGIILISLLKAPSNQSASQNGSNNQTQSAKQTAKSKKSNSSNTNDSSNNTMASNSSGGSSSSSNSGSSSKGSSSKGSSSNGSSGNGSSDNGQANKNSNSQPATASTSENVPASHHTASYSEGSADWKAQVAALSQATGISPDQMTIWWLGNGGGPNASIGRVSAKKSPNQKYVVKLVYKDKHWQAEDVQKPS